MTPAEWQIVAFTAGMAVLSTALILVPGVALAWCLARLRWRGKSLVETVVALPLVLPPVVTGLVLLKLFGRRGPLGHWLYSEFHLDIVFTWRAVAGAGGDVISPARTDGACRD
jgi:molybdate transport system permease protein